jgi:hypothetical protein
MKQTTKHKNETLNEQRKAIWQEKSYKRNTGIKTVNPDRNVDKSIKKSQIRVEFVLIKVYIS